ncbi:hypothetical protein AX17_006738 [Amanita inopinata Kibby_2008]|nr:hypothetical protein AX17_006738 [Amanita inopinata Kibby_2008]
MSLAHPKAWLRRKANRLSQLAGLHDPLQQQQAGHHAVLPISTGPQNQWDLSVPEELVKGTAMTKVSEKQQKQVVVAIDPDEGKILYQSRKNGIIPIESIKELRTGAAASYYRAQFSLSPSSDERWITIIYILDGAYKTLHFIAPTPEVFSLWDTNLRKLHAVRQGLMQGLGNVQMREELWERMYWKGADGPTGDQKLDVKEVEKLCLRLGIDLSKNELKGLFNQADTQNRGYLDFADFQRFVKILKRRPEIEGIHAKLCAENNGIFDFTVFQHFMRDVQYSKLSDEDLKSLFDHYTTPSSPAPPAQTTDTTTPVTSPPPSSMTIDQFQTFLLSQDNTPFSEQNKVIWQDMTRPISEYFISSSHNTYLVGHQLVGVSTIEGYIRALLHSCRTVEMDVYDGPSGEPVVYHGKTLTSKVALRDICYAIAKYAFATSPYPIMISAEIHCSVEQQDKLVETMTEIFGDTLVKVPSDGSAPKIENLPSPEDLKGKIMLKAKNVLIVQQLAELRARRLAEILEAEKAAVLAAVEAGASDSPSSDESDEGVLEELRSTWRRVRGKSPLSRPHSLTAAGGTGRVESSPMASTTSLGCSQTQAQPQPQTQSQPLLQPQPLQPQLQPPSQAKPSGRRKMSDALASLLVYTVGVKCHGLGKTAYVDYAPEYIFSLSENAVNRMIKSKSVKEGSGPAAAAASNESNEGNEGDGGAAVVVESPTGTAGPKGIKTGMWELIKHNQTHLTRIYPKGTRVGSSNYEPHRYWAVGAQVVAINWQTFDLGYMINQSMFQRNGRSGYVLKPEALRRPPALGNEELLSKRMEHFLDITIISGQELPRPKDGRGQDIIDKSILDPYVEVSLHIPDWTQSPFLPPTTSSSTTGTAQYSPATERATAAQATSARTISVRTRSIKNNGFNPIWNEDLCVPFDCVGGPAMRELIFVEIKAMEEGRDEGDKPLGVYCVPLGCLEQGFRHLPLHDAQLSQHLFSTLFVQVKIRDA